MDLINFVTDNVVDSPTSVGHPTSSLFSGTAENSQSLLAQAAAVAASNSASNPGTNNFQAEAARQFLHQLSASHVLNPPSQVDLRESSVNNTDLGVWAVESIPQGTRFGPFLGKWTMEPVNHKFAWEVRILDIQIC